MIISRKPKNLYYISRSPDLDKTIINPGIPNNQYTRESWINNTKKRIIVYPDTSHSILGLSTTEAVGPDQVLYIYKVSGYRGENVYTPTRSDIPWYDITGEKWVLCSIRLEYIGSVTIGSEIKGGSESFRVGPRSKEVILKSYRWKENLKPWEKQGKLK